MESYLVSDHYDLVTPDGVINSVKYLDENSAEITLTIQRISPAFVGYQIDLKHVFFNLKSTLGQLGLHSESLEFELSPKTHSARVRVRLIAIGPLAQKMLPLLQEGSYIGKLFAADERRRVRNPDYLLRMFARSDAQGRPLLSLGGLQGSDDLILEKIDGRTIAYLSLLPGTLTYNLAIDGLLPTLAKALCHQKMGTRSLIQLLQEKNIQGERRVKEKDILLVRTQPLHIRTVFARVVDSLLPQGYHHTSASVLEPTTRASGDVYELFGSSTKVLNDIPLEFYTLEPHREHVFFADRDQLQTCLEQPGCLFKALETAPLPKHHRCATFVVKGDQLLHLTAKDWVSREPIMNEFPGLVHPSRQALMVERYIEQQPSYPFLKAIEEGLITSEGILLLRYFPSPLIKRMLLGDMVQRFLKGVYFQYPSLAHGNFFSHEDRSLLLDLAKFAIPVFWVDKLSEKVLQYVPKPEKDSGLFVPIPLVDTFLKATTFGVYGSNLMEGDFEGELTKLFQGILTMRMQVNHPMLSKDTPLALVTGGGPGVMAIGNRVARTVGILSCANIVDFRERSINEQKQNPYIDAKMTYRLDHLVERQAEFNLDFPIILMGGIGTDFEFALEEVRRKVGSMPPTPVLLFGTQDYWQQKITTRFQCNLKSGTIGGSEWVSNCFYCVQNASQGIKVYKRFFSGTLPIGKGHPSHPLGFVTSY